MCKIIGILRYGLRVIILGFGVIVRGSKHDFYSGVKSLSMLRAPLKRSASKGFRAPPSDLTIPFTLLYTMYIMTNKGDIMKTLKKYGLLDKDFLQGISLFLLPILLKVIA